jgi:DNA (cytosine-5)-methyltransferase 1
MLTVGSLFSGIGGLDLGLERAGMNVIWQSEIDPYGCRVLKKHWPEVVNHGNIKEINWGDVVRPDIICGGYPCQPFSTAGKRNGTDDPRHLWPWVREAISELRPKYAILENVRGHVSFGLNVVLGEMASIGYDAEWNIVSAASIGAPHRRDRVFIVAYPHGKLLETEGAELKTSRLAGSNKDAGQSLAHPNGEGLEGRSRLQERSKEHGRPNVFGTNPQWHEEWTSRQWWELEPNVGRVAYGVPSRVDRLKGLGNAVVPQVAELIGRMVIDYDTNL